jgi:ribosomal-protein-alanine N-acetyltransferase
MDHEDIPQVAEIELEALPTTWPPTSFKRDLGNRLTRYLVAWTQWAEQAKDSAPQSAARPSLETPRPLIQRLLTGIRDLFAPPPEVVHQQRDFVAGYVGLWFTVDEAHIISIAVREAYRRLGLGELLLMGAVELAMARRAQRVTLEARVTNFPAHALYEKYGFQKTGTRKACYADNHEDAVLMTADSILSPSYHELFQARVDAFCQRRGEAVRMLA